MNLWRMAWRYAWSRPLVTLMTLAGVTLGAGLVASVLTLRRETERAFAAESGVFDLVVGAKGSPLQLVLSSVYHMDVPTGNIPLERYQELRNDRRVRAAAPVGLGDNYKGFRIVGTEPVFFGLERADPSGEGRIPLVKLAEGRLFAKDFEAVVGAQAARRAGLKIGDKFFGAHGLVAGAEVHEEFAYEVVGLLESSGLSSDRAIFVSLSSVWEVHEREERLHAELYDLGSADEDKPEPEDEFDEDVPFFFAAQEAEKPVGSDREVTAVLLQLEATGMRFLLAEEIRQNTESMAAIPINEMFRLHEQVLAPTQKALLAVAYVVVLTAALTILTTLSQSAERRRRDVAVMRCLGARPREIFALVVLEALFLSLLGVAAGWALGHAGVHFAGTLYLEPEMGLSVFAWTADATELKALGLVAAMGVLAGTAPAILAYRRAPADDLKAM